MEDNMPKTNRSIVTVGILFVAMVLMVLVSPAKLTAQSSTTGAIAGVVKDPSGAVLPGVAVTAESPALIEKKRTVTTDEHGQYKIVDLRPGIYSVTFSISGFATVRQENLGLNTGVTLPIDAAMRLSTVGETVTVTTATPVVDVENSAPENVLTHEVMEGVPQGGGIQALSALTLGSNNQSGSAPDVGGNKGEQIDSIVMHDSRARDEDELWDGMSWSSGQSTGGLGQRSFVINKVSVQETTVGTGPAGAESGHGGPPVNIVPKEGGDKFHGNVNFTGANTHFQSTNLDDSLRARGLTSGQNIKHIYDLGAGIGGPILHNKLWFWAGFGDWAALEFAPGNYFNATQNTLFYTPDLSRPAYTNTWNYAYDVRLTWQVSKKNKITAYEGYEDFCLCFQSVDTSSISPEAANNNLNRASFLTQVAWTSELTDRLLLRVGYTAALAPGRVNALSPGVSNTDVPIVLQTTGYSYHAYGTLGSLAYGKPVYDEQNGVVALSYVTGSHALKAGYTWQWNNQNYKEQLNSLPGIGPVLYTFVQPAGTPKPVPSSLTEFASPLIFTSRSWVTGAYVEDQWTLKRLTLNLGVRFDATHGYAPAQTVAATAFSAATTFPRVNGIPDFNDVTPRIGAVYNVFGNSKTAIKGAIGKYVLGDYTTTTVANTPANAIVTSAARTWNDANGNYVPDCDLTNTAANGECGALANNGFGKQSLNTTYDPGVLAGWGVRPYNWQADVQIQQQLRPGLGVTAGYFRTWYGNFTVTQNSAVPANQFGTYCITAPTDSRVPALKGQQVCGFHDVNPAYFGKVQNVVTKASNFGGQSEVYNGVDVSVNWRFGKGGLLFGGVSLGQTVSDDCAIANNYPNVTATNATTFSNVTSNTTTPTQFCHVVLGWRNNDQVKLAGSYPLPFHRWGTKGILASMTYQNLPGFPFNSSYVASNTQIAPSLGRNLSACGATTPCTTTVTLTNALYTPFTQTESRLSQLDLRFAKIFTVKRVSIKGNFDIYNIFNANTVVNENVTYNPGTSYLKPTSILGPRMFKLGTNISF